MPNGATTIFDGLNPVQKQAVECTAGPVLIVAGAGSGKTRVLTCRIANILQEGCAPERVLALTFTNKAAREMKERIALMVGARSARRLYMGTFHSVFIRLLRVYADRIGYRSDFTIYDSDDSQRLIKTCIRELQLDDKVYKPKDVQSRISYAKNNLVTAAKYRESPAAIEQDNKRKMPRISEIYALYAQKCIQSGVMDFDDVLLNMNILLRDSPDACAGISGMFDHILVDEYQDTNMAQYIILKRLAAGHRNLCVVGDDSQSIYGFRGARVENILNFRKDYPDARIFRLEQNYRSTQTIVNAANSVIEKNSSRIPKTCFSKGDEGDKIKLIKAFTETEEAMLTVSAILGLIRSESAQYQDFAILYRTNAQSRALEEALRKRNVPYKVFSGNSFYERAEIRDAMAYLKLTVNINDDESFRRIVNKPVRGIGDTSVTALAAAAHGHGTTLFKAAYEPDLETYGLKPAAIARIRGFCDFIAKLSVRAATEDAYTVADEVLKGSGLWQSLKADNSVEGQSRFANLEELLNAVKLFMEDRDGEYVEDMIAEEKISSADELKPEDYPVVRLGDYLENVSLVSAADVSDEESANRVALMTVHTSKGLEFPYVFIAGLEENLFPSGGWLAPENEIEEERRLFYVAVTRAEKKVSLSFAKTRMRHGKSESNAPSRFLYEIDKQYILNPISRDDEEEESGGAPSFGNSGSRGFGGSGYMCRRQPGIPPRPDTQSRPAAKPVPTPVARPSSIQRPVRKMPSAPAPDFVPSPVTDLRAGQRIEHNRFGAGTIRQLSGTAPDIKAVIQFDDFGEKILLLKYAKVRII